MSIIWDEVEAIGARARELGIRPIYAPTEEAQRTQVRCIEEAALKRIFDELDNSAYVMADEDVAFLKGMGWL